MRDALSNLLLFSHGQPWPVMGSEWRRQEPAVGRVEGTAMGRGSK